MRDDRIDATLREAGWRVIRFWEHDDMGAAASSVAEIIEGCRLEDAVP